jgi:serine protease Do
MTRRLHPVGIAGLFGLCLLWVGTAFSASLPDFSELVEKNSPAVVNISTKQTEKMKRAMPHGFKMPEVPEDSPFHDFLKRFFGDDLDIPDHFDSRSLGSGFIISGDGYVMTNHHVVAEADEIVVRLSDRREFVAKVIGSDKASDVALIKIDATDLPTVKVGKSSDIKVGEWVLAIGSPFGFDHSATVGIVSAKGRSLPSENYVPFIQTDVAINPGNSGGPLFNLDGEVVGINSQIYSRTGGFMGLSFAIPIEVAMNVVDQLRASGRVARGYLGVLIQDVTRELAESFGMRRPSGALVAQVLPDGPASKAGIRPGDVVLEFNGKELNNSAQLPPLVGASRINEPADLVVLRNGKRMDFKVTVAELPGEDDDEPAKAATSPKQPQPPKADVLGLVVGELTDELRKRSGIEAKGGVVVRTVEAGAARAAGVREGDVITLFDGQEVTGPSQFHDLVGKTPAGRSVAVLVQRREGPMFIALRMPTK